MSERVTKMFWVVETEPHRVRYLKGFACDGNNYWWVPEAGYSMTVGHHLFDTKGEAVAKCRSEIQQKITALNSDLIELNKL